MEVIDLELNGAKKIILNRYHDERGYFQETYSEARYKKILGEDVKFVQDNFSFSKKGVLRGLHYQVNYPQGKLVTVLKGAVLDVIVDLDKTSDTFGKHISVEIRAEEGAQLWIPPQFAHGFYALTEDVEFSYKCTDFYRAGDEAGISWECPMLGINWPDKSPILSEKDRAYPGFNEAFSR